MIRNYTQDELEDISEKLLQQFDSERLEIPKPIDVYKVVENCLGVPYEWQYISPDQSILGLTIMKSGYYWIWPKPYFEKNMKPEKVFFKEGTILIERSLTERAERGRENFTVIHEVFHNILHKDFFAENGDVKCVYESLREHPDHRFGLENLSELDICEFQANYCATCFLMPKRPFTDRVKKLSVNTDDNALLSEMAKEFSVTKKAVQLRMQMLGLQ